MNPAPSRPKFEHACHPYLRRPTHAITVDVAGAGGTGSQLLPQLVRLHRVLVDRGSGGLHVRVFDPGLVTEPNLVRQLFSPSDLHQSKAAVLVSRINRTYGTNWQAYETCLGLNWTNEYHRDGNRGVSNFPVAANITISCVDTASARQNIGSMLAEAARRYENFLERDFGQDTHFEPWQHPLYWLDLGNEKDFGQAVLGTVAKHIQPDGRTKQNGLPKDLRKAPAGGWVGKLPTIAERFRTLASEEVVTTPSCSVVEALNKQDLTVNNFAATYGMTLLWDLLTQRTINRCGVYFNLRPFGVAEVAVQPLTLALPSS